MKYLITMELDSSIVYPGIPDSEVLGKIKSDAEAAQKAEDGLKLLDAKAITNEQV